MLLFMLCHTYFALFPPSNCGLVILLSRILSVEDNDPWKNDHEILQIHVVLVIPLRTEYFGIMRESCDNSTTPSYSVTDEFAKF